MTDLNGQLEAWLRAFDARYLMALVPRVRIGIVTGAVSPLSYSVRLPGESGDRDGVPTVSAITPQVGDGVRLELVGDPPAPVIVDVVGRRPLRQSTSTSALAQTGSATYIVSGAGTDQLAIDLISGQLVRVTISAKMSHTLDTGHGAVMSFRVTGATAYGPNDDDGCEQDNIGGATCTRTTHFTPTATGTHTFTLMYKAINGANANFSQRRLMVED